LPLFAAIVPESDKQQISEVETKLKALNVDELSPRQALQLIYELKGIAGGQSKDIPH
jgi:DNA mismatch repair protein MutS